MPHVIDVLTALIGNEFDCLGVDSGHHHAEVFRFLHYADTVEAVELGSGYIIAVRAFGFIYLDDG